MNSFFQKIKDNYSELYELFGGIWRVYGGKLELFSSPFFHLSFIITIVLYSTWSKPLWWDLVIAVIPSLLGFTLGGYAILLAFGNEEFLRLIAGEGADGSSSPFLDVSSAFFHFIMIQVVALIYAIIAKNFYMEVPSWLNSFIAVIGIPLDFFIATTQLIFWGIGFFFFIYSLFHIVSAALSVYSLADTFDIFNSNKNKKSEQ